jgi:D-serine deaminase-like pyridoxal phosphate-dependent protein
MGQDLLSVWFKDGGGGHGLIVGHPGWEIFQLSEEHGWMRWVGVDSPTPMPVGTELQILPNHICSVFHALGRSVILRNGERDAEWTATARGASQ